MFTVGRLSSSSSRLALQCSSRVSVRFVSNPRDNAWLQSDKLESLKKEIVEKSEQKKQRLAYAEKILPYYVLFPKEADPTKPSKEALDAIINANPVPPPPALPNWREAVEKEEQEIARKEAERAAKKAQHHH